MYTLIAPPPHVHTPLAQVRVSYGRIARFLASGDLAPTPGPSASDSPSAAAVFEGLTLSWWEDKGAEEEEGEEGIPCFQLVNLSAKADKEKTLEKTPGVQGVSLEIRKGKLTIIVGETAAGKSTLVGALTAGAAERTSGKARVRSDGPFVALASQEEWVGSGSIKSQIVWGRPFNQREYEAAIYAAGLDIDFGTTLEKGDATQVGDGGTKVGIWWGAAVFNGFIVLSSKSVELI